MCLWQLYIQMQKMFMIMKSANHPWVCAMRSSWEENRDILPQTLDLDVHHRVITRNVLNRVTINCTSNIV